MVDLEVLDTSQYSWRRYDMTNQKSVLIIDVEKHESVAEESRKRFRSSDLLKTPKDNPFKCGECSYSTRKRNNLIAHMRIHSGVKPYSCETCTFATTHKILLRKHRNQCRDIQVLSCSSREGPRCFKPTTSTAHILQYDTVEIDSSDESHSPIKPNPSTQDSILCKTFRCNICTYSTRKMNNLEAHQRVHSGVRPFKARGGG